MNILVTGGAGFIGSHVVDAYINAGHYVTVIDDLSMGVKENINPKAKFVKMDIRDGNIRGIFDQQRFDIVNHHAAQMDVRKSVDDPLFDASVNILGTINLIENCLRYGVRKFIFASTGGAIYGDQDYFPADENHPLRPVSPYGISKLSIEKYLHYYHEVHGLQYVSLRYANVYGPRQNPQGEAGVIAIFTSKMLSGKQPIINGDGKQTRDYLYVDDVVKANLFAFNYNDSGIFNIGTGVETDVNHLFVQLRELTGIQCKEVHGLPRKGEQRRSVLDHSYVKKVFGWEPSVSLHEGLRRTVEYFRNHQER
ncbi:MAG: NAD-dependent epimerase/dehydratase family protein [Ignavibacteriae bacterium]|nr:NAD-dependent epimerase/dehydratase family protein [Ignavibacteriota bacterium]